MNTVIETLYRTGIIPVVKIDRAEDAVPMAKALMQGGLPAAEITFRTPAAAESILRIAREVPEIFVCAGTVLSPQQAETAVQCGAKAIISPGTNPAVVKHCQELGVPVFPGCATPSEVENAMALGLEAVKLFPASVVGGVSMLKALYGPYAAMRFMPTGGINPQNVVDYLAQPNVIACGGSWICPEKLITAGDYAGIAKLAAAAATLVRRLRTYKEG